MAGGVAVLLQTTLRYALFAVCGILVSANGAYRVLYAVALPDPSQSTHWSHSYIEAVGCTPLFEPSTDCEFGVQVGGTAN